jgi:hypothetical protein
MEREATSLQMVKKQISKDLVHNSAMSPTRQSTSVRAALAALTLALVTGCVSVSPPPPTAPPTNAPSQAPTTSAPRTLEPTLAPTPSSPSDSAAPTTSPDGSEGPATPGATIDPALAEQIDAVNAQVPPIRQLEALEDVPYTFLSREEFQANLLETAFEDVPEDWRRAEERFLKRMGLIADDADLEQLILDLYGEAVAAYYDPETGSFYIIQRDEPFGPSDKVTTAHEYTHALQDQHFDLEANRIKDLPEGDAILGQLAAIEGDATLTSQQWLLQHLSTEEQGILLQEALEDLGNNPFEGMPILLRRQLEFPYAEGFVFVDEVFRLGGFEAVNQAIQTPPASTEQVLHPQKYFDQELPIDVTLDDLSGALGDGWTIVYEQEMGELNTQVFAGGGEQPVVNIPGLPVQWPHAEVAAGWGGDRLNMYENGDQWLVDWQTTWDTEADATEFASRTSELISTIDGETRVSSEGTSVRLVVASDAELFLALPSG